MNSADKWMDTEVDAYALPNEENMYAGTHMISNLRPATVYVAKVSSRNIYGYSNPSQVFKFATRGAGKKNRFIDSFFIACLDGDIVTFLTLGGWQ